MFTPLLAPPPCVCALIERHLDRLIIRLADTDTQATERATSAATGRICAMHTYDAA